MQPFLMSCDRQTEMAKSNWIAAVLNVLGNVLLIPSFGIKGAAAATLISEAVLVALFILRLKAIFGWPRIGAKLVISGTATAVFFLTFAFLPSYRSLVIVVPTSLLLYLATLLLFKEIRQNEVRSILDFLKSRSRKIV